jgi:aryl-alcohol dehydrogenase-like predicted oxidoreductase
MNDATLDAVRRLHPVADEARLMMVEMALAWVLRRPELAAAIIGASRPDQVHSHTKASGVELSPDTLAAIDTALGDTPVKEPRLGPFAQAGVKHDDQRARSTTPRRTERLVDAA